MAPNGQFLPLRATPLSLEAFPAALFWLVDLRTITEEEYNDALGWLEDATKERINGFAFVSDRHRGALTHAALRILLSHKLGVSPRALVLQRDEYGKPFVEGYPLHFNMSHTKEYAFIGIHPHSPIGVDIEKWQQPLPADTWINEDERMIVEQHDTSEGIVMLALWCAKEAALKATGKGFMAEELPLLRTIEHRDEGHLVFQIGEQTVHVYRELLTDYFIAVSV